MMTRTKTRLGLLSLFALLLSNASASSLPDDEPTHPFLADLPWNIDQPAQDRFTLMLDQMTQQQLDDLQERLSPSAPTHSANDDDDDHNRPDEFASSHDRYKRDWSIPTSGLPSLPVSAWIATNASSWPILANAAVRRMQTWFLTDTNLYDISWWQNPVVLLSFLDLDRALGNSVNQQAVTAVLDNNSRGVQYMIDQYVDDSAWWGLVTARAYQQYGNSNYLTAARAIQAADAGNWTSDCGGGIVWLTYKPDYGKNTVTNTLQIALSAKLYLITGEESYLEDAQRTLNWWQSWAYNPSTGKIYDTLTAYECVQTYEQLFTYNSAIIIGGLVDLYEGTKNQTYLSMAQNIAYAAIRDFSTSQGVMRESCEGDGPPNNTGGVSAADGGPVNNLPAGCQSDTIMFKSILAQNLGYYFRATSDPKIYNYLATNFMFNALYNMDNTFLFGEFWSGPFNATLANKLTQGNALGLLSAGVAVNLQTINDALNASGQHNVAITQSFTVPMPGAGQNPSTRKRRSILFW
ncbi:Six-hairpin glycosidase [Meredithblackwellia eburnea MCA 4105]